MNNEETTETSEQTQSRTLRKSGSKAAASFKKLLTRRMSRSISSERTPGSATSSTDNAVPEKSRKKLLNLVRTRKKKRTQSMSDRGAVTDRPRRSMSVDDLEQLKGTGDEDEDETPDEAFVKYDKELTVPVPDDADTLVNKSSGQLEELVHPETPIPEQHLEQRGDTRSSSNISFNTEETEQKETKPVTEITSDAEAGLETEIKELEGLDEAHFDVPTDAAASIDASIAETVMKSLATGETIDLADDDVHVIEPENMNEIDETKTTEVVNEPAVEAETIETETTEEMHQLAKTEAVVETETVGESSTPAVVETENEPVVEEPTLDAPQIKDRDIDLADLPKMTEKEPPVPEQKQAIVPDKTEDKPVSKPKRRRRIRLIKSASISVAAMAVGLLILVFKHRH